MKRRMGITLLVVLILSALMVTTSLAQGNDPGTSTTNAVLQNKSMDTTAAVMVEYYDNSGTVQHTDNVSIEPLAVVEVKTQDTPLPSGFVGSAVVSSDQPLASIVSIKNTNVPGADDGFTQGAYNGTSTPANTILFPTVWGFSGITSRVTVQNAEGTAADVTLYFFDREGTDLGNVTVNLQAYAAETFNLGDTNDLPSGWPSDFADGSIRAESSNMLAGASTATWFDGRSAAYQALTSAEQGTVLYAPSHFRFKVSSGNPSDYDLFSAINIQNTSTTDDAPITVEYYTRGDTSGTPALTLNATIPASSAIGLNTKNGGSLDAGDFAPLGDDWDGSVKIISDNDIPLVGTGVTNWGVNPNLGVTNKKAGIYALVSANAASSTIYVPAQYRLRGLLGGTEWNQWSAINLQNIGSSTVAAADLTVTYIDTDGNEIASFSGSELPGDLAGGAAFGLNTRNGGDLDASAFDSFGDGFIGGILVEGPAGAELVSVNNIIYSNRASVYNGEGQ